MKYIDNLNCIQFIIPTMILYIKLEHLSELSITIVNCCLVPITPIHPLVLLHSSSWLIPLEVVLEISIYRPEERLLWDLSGLALNWSSHLTKSVWWKLAGHQAGREFSYVICTTCTVSSKVEHSLWARSLQRDMTLDRRNDNITVKFVIRTRKFVIPTAI